MNIVCDLSTKHILVVFAAKQGLLHKLSDNGRTFKVTDNCFNVVLKDQTIQEHLAIRGSQ